MKEAGDGRTLQPGDVVESRGRFYQVKSLARCVPSWPDPKREGPRKDPARAALRQAQETRAPDEAVESRKTGGLRHMGIRPASGMCGDPVFSAVWCLSCVCLVSVLPDRRLAGQAAGKTGCLVYGVQARKSPARGGAVFRAGDGFSVAACPGCSATTPRFCVQAHGKPGREAGRPATGQAQLAR